MSIRHAWKGAGYGAAAGAMVAMLVVVLALWSVIVAFMTPSPESSAFDLASLNDRADAHDLAYDEKLLAQLNGRSMFFVPPKPPPPPPPPTRNDEPREDRPPPPPSRYAGPDLVAIFYDQAWFDNGERLSVGESAAGVEVLELAPPWNVRVRWRDVEFTIELFERDQIVVPK